MGFEITSVPSAPEYAKYRNAAVGLDTLPVETRGHGVNAKGYRFVHVQILPGGTANPSVVVLWWSDEAGAFVAEHAGIAFAGLGADVPYEFTIEPRGRRFLIAFTALAAGTCDVMISGFGQDETL